MTKVLLSLESFYYMWLRYSAKKAGTTYQHIEKHSWNLSLWPRHMPSQLLCTEGKHQSAGQRKTSTPPPPRRFLWERWAETKVNIFEKSEKKKQNRFLESHSFSLIGMPLAGAYKENFCWSGKHWKNPMLCETLIPWSWERWKNQVPVLWDCFH